MPRWLDITEKEWSICREQSKGPYNDNNSNYTHSHTSMHTHTHTNTQTNTHTHTHTHTHTNTQINKHITHLSTQPSFRRVVLNSYKERWLINILHFSEQTFIKTHTIKFAEGISLYTLTRNIYYRRIHVCAYILQAPTCMTVCTCKRYVPCSMLRQSENTCIYIALDKL